MRNCCSLAALVVFASFTFADDAPKGLRIGGGADQSVKRARAEIAESEIATNVVDLTDPGNVIRRCDTCPPGLLARICPKKSEPKRPHDCIGCSSFRCEWRLMFGSCAAFYGEGRYRSIYPDNCPCSRP